MAATQTCSLNRTWVLKTGIFLVLALGFGLWALYDAAVLYPARGLADASSKLKEYLDAADKAGYLVKDKIASPDPRGELAQLDEKLSELRTTANGSSVEARAAEMKLRKQEWLTSLQRVWKLDAQPKPLGGFSAPVKRDLFFDPKSGEGYAIETGGKQVFLAPQALLNDLKTYWNSAPAQAKPLSAWDLPVQWLFVAVGLGVGGWLIWLMIKCHAIARKITFEPEAQRLTVPSGASMTPADLEDVDKRQWHKFYVTLVTRDGGHHKLDLLRYVPLEEWVLGMERTRFPDRVKEDEASSENGGAEQAGDSDAAGVAGNEAAANPNT